MSWLLSSLAFYLFIQVPEVGLHFVEIKGEKFKVELAANMKDWAKGLMHREKLGPREGMLFISTTEKHRNFWMKNTYISLDIVFLSADKKIVHIARNTKPLSERLIPSKKPAQYILEVRAGTAAELGWEEGDSVSFDLN